MAANVQNTPGRTDWAEDDEPDLATAIPAPQITRNKDGTETIVTVFINEDGKRVKRTQRIRRTIVKKKENPRVAERRGWAKIGPEAGKPAGPRPDATTLGENIIFRPQVGFKSGQVQETAPEEDKKAETLKKMQIKCRICSGDHFTTKCPFKDTMAPEGEAAGAPASLDDGAGGDAGGGAVGPGGSYVPPHLRKGGASKEGERMGGKFERDDLATLRVTNVSEFAEESDLREIFERHGRVTRVFLAKDRETGRAKGFAFVSYQERSDAAKACERVDGYGFGHLILKVEFAKKPPARKEKAQKDDEDGTEEITDRPRQDEDAIEVKSKSSEPSPIPGAADGKAASAGGGESGSSGGDGGGRKRKAQGRELVKPSVPDVYPQVMAIPIAQRPLFPGFYKAITIRDPNVIAAVQELLKRGQSYVGGFLLKDQESSQDVINDPSEVYDVGTFCQITGAFPAGHNEERALQAVLYPHRRIRLSELIPPNRGPPSPPEPEKAGQAAIEAPPSEEQGEKPETEEQKGGVSASFEEQQQQQNKESTSTAEKAVVVASPTAFLRSWPVSLVNVENLADEPFDKKAPTIRALIGEIVNTCKEIGNVNHLFRDHVSAFAMSQSAANIADEPAKLADFAAAVSGGEMEEAQGVLAALNIETRLSKALEVIKKEHMNAQLSSKISKDVESKIQKRQREYWLMEQMKGIRRELGLESDGKDKLVEKFKEKANKLAMPEQVKKVFDEELNKLAHLEPAASEFNVTRNYLDWLTQIPWGQRSAENFGIKHAREVLDEDHYGLKDVKDRILEFIAVGKLRGTVEGKILCMVGPPGVGKTSIGKSIARALNRQYYRFSVGGLTDVAEIKGHRRTYVGALPGRIIQALKKCQTENPLVLIDEVDKIGRGHQGDPSSALLELLDPEQNNSFLDHYMDVPVDLSKVLFVCTANMTDTIPRPLLDRMEMIELSGYVAEEKMAIAERYLAPQAKEMSGLKDVDVDLTKDAITELINKYARESGVRNLKKHIEKVYRKSALKIIQDLGEEEGSVLSEDKALTVEGKEAQAAAATDGTETKDTPSSQQMEAETTETPRVSLNVPDTVHVAITKDNLPDYVGPPIFTFDRLYDTTPPGVAMGLAWTQMGGAALYVESILEASLSHASRPGFERTGNLKPVMKESTQIAYSFAKGFMARRFPGNKFFEKARIHLHCPEGAVQKDGPSAGITMATSLMSLGLGRAVDATVAMTGELTVTGKVLRIGGLREKTVAARRAGARMVIFPKDNTSDWLELPENIKEGIEGKPVEWYSDVFALVFPDVKAEEANRMWREELRRPTKEEREAEEEQDGRERD
ncbi:ATP-dependent Lon protease pim1 [Friedmanniomyces endolithicus]|nr:ATP-dependent Lon protease pim1 [Friedmanniomyces endolithicus]